MAGHSASSRQRPGHPRPLGAGEGRRGCPGAKMLLALPGMTIGID